MVYCKVKKFDILKTILTTYKFFNRLQNNLSKRLRKPYKNNNKQPSKQLNSKQLNSKRLNNKLPNSKRHSNKLNSNSNNNKCSNNNSSSNNNYNNKYKFNSLNSFKMDNHHKELFKWYRMDNQ